MEKEKSNIVEAEDSKEKFDRKLRVALGIGMLAVVAAGIFLVHGVDTPKTSSLDYDRGVTIERRIDSAPVNGYSEVYGGSGRIMNLTKEQLNQKYVEVSQCGFEAGKGGGWTTDPADSNGCIERTIPVSESVYNNAQAGEVVSIDSLKI